MAASIYRTGRSHIVCGTLLDGFLVCHDQFSGVFASSEIFVKPEVFCAVSGFGAPG
jgi:hypothetical protein